VQDPVVVGLGDTDELAVVALCAHDAAVVQLVHGWADPEAVAEVQLLKVRKKHFSVQFLALWKLKENQMKNEKATFR
jgi:hypothetical protein